MNDKINNICKIEMAALHQVVEFAYLPNKLLYIDAVWEELDFIPGADLFIGKRRTKAGLRYDSEFNTGIRSAFLNPDSYIMRLTFSDGNDPMIIGSVDLPIRLEEDHNLTSKRLTFSYSSWHYPYRVASDTGSGSGGGGV